MSAATDTLTRTYRRQSLALRSVTLRDLQRLWPTFEPDEKARSYAQYLAAVAVLTQRDRTRASAMAAQYLREFRATSGVAGNAVIVRAPATVQSERLATSMLVTSVVAFREARGTGQDESEALKTAFVRSAGAVGRLVLEAGRDTIRGSLAGEADANPDTTVGWRRITAPGACDWCLMLADRGAVYSAQGAGFSAHDHCACSVEPAYGGSRQAVRPYEPMDRRLSEETRRKNRERAKAWIAEHRDRLRADAAANAA